ncbi:MAG: hypothetical protein IJH37_00070 [Clostridia bacterium]|nr:hypothetical protein [Clostridia bacterium]
MRKIIIPLLFTVLIPFSVSAKKAPAPTPVPMSQDGDTLLFDFGAEPEYGWVQVSEKTKYTKDNGYGFSMVSFIEDTDTPAESGVVSDAIKVSYRYHDRTEFMADLPEGIYEIAVYTGSIRSMTINLEGYPALFDITDSCSETRMEIPVTDGTLNMMLMPATTGTDLAVSAMTITRKISDVGRRKRMFICGDSIAATMYPLLLDPPYEKNIRGGWGQMLSAYVPENLYVHNISSPGANASTYLKGSTIEDRLHFAKDNDIVIISLGINDRRSTTNKEYIENLKELAERIRALGCTPVLCSDAARLLEYHGYSYIDLCYAAETKSAARMIGADYIDLHEAYSAYMCSMGYKKTPDLFLQLWNGSLDLTHPNRTGADIMAQLIAKKLKIYGIIED